MAKQLQFFSTKDVEEEEEEAKDTFDDALYVKDILCYINFQFVFYGPFMTKRSQIYFSLNLKF